MTVEENEMSHKEKNREEFFENSLKLLRNYTKQFELMLELVEGVAWERMKQEPDFRERSFLTHDEAQKLKESLVDRIPWSFTPNYQDFGAKKLQAYDRRNYEALKHNIKKLKDTFDNIEMKP